jgi:hypothetical protein
MSTEVTAERVEGRHDATWSGLRDRISPALLPAAVAFATIASLAAANGGYFPTSWGWASVGLAWTGAIALVLAGYVPLGVRETLYLGAVAGLTAWTAVSISWSRSPTESWLEFERTIVYALGVLAAIAIVRRRNLEAFLVGTWAAVAVICTYSLLKRLFPDWLAVQQAYGGIRLANPIGYWNGLGIFAVMGALLALGLATRARSLVLRAIAGASLTVLVPTLYFTFSRGAWIALGVAAVLAVVLDPRRLQLVTGLVVAVPAALAAYLASRETALTHTNSTVASAVHEGRRLAVVVLVLALASGGAALVFALLERRVRFGREAHRAGTLVLLAGAVAAIVFVFAAYGSPSHIAHRVSHAFKAKPYTGANLNKRLFSLSGNFRSSLWSSASHDAQAHPWLGSGAGSFQQYYLEHRKGILYVKDAHNLYVETLAELGAVGLALLAVALAVPLAAAVVARHRRYAPFIFAAYVAYLVHAAADWDWEQSAITLLALFCGVLLLVSARAQDRRAALIGMPVRAAAAACALAIGAFAFVGLVGNLAIQKSTDAANAGNWKKSAQQARRAHTWAPWSAEPLQLLGEAQIKLHQVPQARVSFERAIAKDRRNWLLWYDLWRVTAGRRARVALATATRLDPVDVRSPG